LTVSAPGPGCVAWAHDDGDEQTRLPGERCRRPRDVRRAWLGPSSRSEVPGRPRHAAVSEAMREKASATER